MKLYEYNTNTHEYKLLNDKDDEPNKTKKKEPFDGVAKNASNNNSNEQNNKQKHKRSTLSDTSYEIDYIEGHEFIDNPQEKPKFAYKLFTLVIVGLFMFIFNNYFGIFKDGFKYWLNRSIFPKDSNRTNYKTSNYNYTDNTADSIGFQNGVCYNDPVFDFFEEINQKYATHSSERHSLLITSSLAMDVAVYSSFFVWAFKAKNWVFLIALLIFYFIRQILLSFFVIRFPEGYIFDSPVIQALTVSYFKTNDFFYSGHIGITIIIFLEFRERKINKYLCFLFVLITLLESFTMIALRGHYFIDVLYGVLMAIYCYRKAHVIEDWLKRYFGLLVEEEEESAEEKDKAIAKWF